MRSVKIFASAQKSTKFAVRTLVAARIKYFFSDNHPTPGLDVDRESQILGKKPLLGIIQPTEVEYSYTLF